MPLRLRYKTETRFPVELGGLVPTWTRDRSLEEIERLQVLRGNERLPLAELFDVAGNPSDQIIEIEGNLANVHSIGTGMDGGIIRVEGSAGREVGSHMSAGEITVSGSVGDRPGVAMSGGLIRIRGNSGDHVGAADYGSPRGMTGGTILVGGNVGQQTGRSMRRGLIAVGGSAGEFTGPHMLAGTVLVFGECGLRPGADMRRGTIALFGNAPPLLPTFSYDCRYRADFLRLTLMHLRRLDFNVPEEVFGYDFDLYHGDRVNLGRGEILIKAA